MPLFFQNNVNNKDFNEEIERLQGNSDFSEVKYLNDATGIQTLQP